MFARLIPAPLVRLFAARYVAGDSVEQGLEVARRLLLDRLVLTTVDLLGESVTDAAEVREGVRTYQQIIDAIAADRDFRSSGYRPGGSALPTVSLKPSAFTVGAPEDAAAPITRLAEQASARGVAVTIDMEDHRFTDFTIGLAVDLYERGLDVGVVLQTRLFRTPEDLLRIPAGMRVRLVIGIYVEPARIALTDKREMKERMLAQAQVLLERGVRVEFATHDEATLERFLREVAPIAPEHCEIQMLLGVPRDGFVRRMRSGVFGTMLPVRLYVPFAVGWDDATAYLRRRIRETPNMVWLVLKNLLPHSG